MDRAAGQVRDEHAIQNRSGMIESGAVRHTALNQAECDILLNGGRKDLIFGILQEKPDLVAQGGS